MFEEKMLRDIFLHKIQELKKKGFEIIKKKNADYSEVNDNFINFITSANAAGVTVEQGILVRMTDKLIRCRNLINRGSTHGEAGEAIKDTLSDLANYADILNLYISEYGLTNKNEEENKEETAEDIIEEIEEQKEEINEELNESNKNWFSRLISNY